MREKEDARLADAFAGLGGIGAKFASRFLRDDVYEIGMDVGLHDPSQGTDDAGALLMDMARGVLADEDEDVEEEQAPGAFGVNGVVGAGFYNMNPALVKVLFSTGTDQRMHITIIGQAKEGLIKQHAGRQAAQKIARRLADRLEGSKIFRVNGYSGG